MRGMLNDKNVLIIMPFFFGYQNSLRNYLKGQGVNVYMIDEEIVQYSLLINILRLASKSLYSFFYHLYFKLKFQKLPSKLDKILVIKGSTLSKEEMIFLKKTYQDAGFIMYQWDSVATFPESLELSKWFDKIFTFDPNDSKKYDWIYRSLFFDPNMCDRKKIRDIDISFVASLHSERLKIYHELKKISSLRGYNSFIYLFSDKWRFFRQKVLKRNNQFDVNLSEVNFKALPPYATADVYDRSMCVLDYKFPLQSGLTMRTIECIGHHCKLITNNKEIIKEDFYNPHNVLIYNGSLHDIPNDFVDSEYEPLPESIYNKYTLAGWIDDVLV